MRCPQCGHSDDAWDHDPTARRSEENVLPVRVICWIVTFAVFATLFSLQAA